MKIKKVICYVLIFLVSIGFIIYSSLYSNRLHFQKGNSNRKIGKSVEIHMKNYSIEYPVIGNKKIDSQITDTVNKYASMFLKSNDHSYMNYETYMGVENNMSLIFIITVEKNHKISKEVVDIYNYNLSSGERLKDSYFFLGEYNHLMNEYLKKYILEDEYYKESCDINKIKDDNKIKYAVTNKGFKVYYNRGEICDSDDSVVSFNVPYDVVNSIINVDISKRTTQKNAFVKVKKDKYKSINKNMYVGKYSNFYSDDNKNSDLVGHINVGSRVYVIKSNKEWSLVRYHDKEGYINNNVLNKQKVYYEGYNAVNEDVYALSNIEVHISDDINSEVLYTIKHKEKIKRIGINDNGWSELLYNDDIVFVYSTYLTHDKKQLEKKKIDVKSIDPNVPMVALTFDDGPNPDTTNRILNTLEANGAVATFFELGNLMNNYPDVVKREEAIGCEVASHTFAHRNLNKMSANEIQDDMAQSEAAFMNILGHKPTLVRPPYGNANDLVKANIPYPLINWDIDTLDWKNRNKDTVLNSIRSIDNYNGCIILMHSVYPSTADAVEVIVPELIAKGYQLVTVSQMAEARGVTLSAGQLYYNFVN